VKIGHKLPGQNFKHFAPPSSFRSIPTLHNIPPELIISFIPVHAIGLILIGEKLPKTLKHFMHDRPYIRYLRAQNTTKHFAIHPFFNL